MDPSWVLLFIFLFFLLFLFVAFPFYSPPYLPLLIHPLLHLFLFCSFSGVLAPSVSVFVCFLFTFFFFLSLMVCVCLAVRKSLWGRGRFALAVKYAAAFSPEMPFKGAVGCGYTQTKLCLKSLIRRFLRVFKVS